MLITSEKVTDKLDEVSTQVALSAGVIDEMVGAITEYNDRFAEILNR